MSVVEVMQWVGLGASIVGALAAVGAWLRAGRANGIAQKALDQQNEDHYVRWEGDWSGPGDYRLHNRGNDTAHSVLLDITVGGRGIRIQRPQVEAGGFIAVDARQEAGEVITELEERLRAQARARTPQGNYGLQLPNVAGFYPRLPSGVLRYHVTWTSELGRRHSDSASEVGMDYGVKSGE